MPADDHDTTFPCVSVIEMIVLLKVAATWATPTTTFFFSFFLCARAAGFAVADGAAMCVSYFVTFFLPAMARAGPLRVRPFVWLRCHRTGRAFRWTRPRWQP